MIVHFFDEDCGGADGEEEDYSKVGTSSEILDFIDKNIVTEETTVNTKEDPGEIKDDKFKEFQMIFNEWQDKNK